MKNKYITLLFIVFAAVVLDQWTKSMAVDYLRRPERSDLHVSCTTQRERCNDRCLQRAKTHGNLSLVACKRRCQVREEVCQSRFEADHKLAMLRWKQRQREMKQSIVCRRVEYAGSSRPECVVVPNYFHFTYRINRGAAWGIFSDLPPNVRRPFFVAITLVALLFIMFLFSFRLDHEHRLMVIALSLILGGALGNFLDRIRLDYVVDFIEWFWRDRRYTWPTFNIADVAISCGVVLIAIELFFFAPPLEEEEDEDAATEETREGPTLPPPKPLPPDEDAATEEIALPPPKPLPPDEDAAKGSS